MQLRFGTAATIALAAVACGCGSNSSSTSPTSTSQSTQTGATTPPAAPAPSPTPTPAVSDPGGEWNLTTPAGLPRGGCISLSDISGNELDWTVQSVAGHPHRILMQGVWTWESVPGCSPLASGGDLVRSLSITNGGWTFLAGDQGTRTISWPTSFCSDDGGRFKIDIQVERDVPSVGNGDRETVELLVNCGFSRQP
jgi:hypothetical protein